jgi:hypothetical protein
MQNFAAIQILMLGASLVFPGSALRADAAPMQSFDVGYGWDAGFAYAPPDLANVAVPVPSISAVELRADAVDGVFEARTASPRKSVVIPVPGSLVLFGSGLVMLAIFARRRTPRRHA